MLALLSVRSPSITPFCRATYALLAAYAADRRIPPLDPFVNTGPASAVLRLSDALEATGKSAWDDVGPELVETACQLTDCQPLLPYVLRAVVDFRRWLVETGRATDAGLAALEQRAAELPETDTLDGEPAPHMNRAARRATRRAARRGRHAAN